MIVGYFTADKQARFSLVVFDSDENAHTLDVGIDTGYNGYLTLPAATITEFGLVHHSDVTAVLGDGNMVPMRRFEVLVEWHGQRRKVYVLESNGGVLVGTSLLYGSRVRMDMVDGGPVEIEPLTESR